MYHQTSPKMMYYILDLIYWIYNIVLLFTEFYIKQLNCFEFFKSLITAVKPKNNNRLLNGCHLTDREGRPRKVVWLKSQCFSQIWITRQVKICLKILSWWFNFHHKSHQHFDWCQCFKCKYTNIPCASLCLKFEQDIENSTST